VFLQGNDIFVVLSTGYGKSTNDMTGSSVNLACPRLQSHSFAVVLHAMHTLFVKHQSQHVIIVLFLLFFADGKSTRDPLIKHNISL